MSDSFPSVPDPVARFFDNYLICLAKVSVPEKQRRWTIKRIEGFIKAHSGHKIKSLTSQEVSAYLEMLGRENRLLGWRFSQCIHAIRILYCDLLGTAVCLEIDWEYWRDSARQLEFDHPTTARQLTPEELSFRKTRKEERPLNQIRSSHRMAQACVCGYRMLTLPIIVFMYIRQREKRIAMCHYPTFL